MAAALAEHTFTSLGWAMLANKIQLTFNDAGTVMAEGRNAECFEYDGDHPSPSPGERADVWIWGVAFVD